MTVQELIRLNMNDNFRFYKKSDTNSLFYIDEYTPYIKLNEIMNSNLKESKVFSFYIDGEYCANEIIDEWICVILEG